MSLAASAGNLGLWIWNIPRDDIWLSEKGRALFGLADSKPINLSNFLEAVHADDRERMRQRIQSALSREDEYESEYRITQQNGETRWVSGYGASSLTKAAKWSSCAVSLVTLQSANWRRKHCARVKCVFARSRMSLRS